VICGDCSEIPAPEYALLAELAEHAGFFVRLHEYLIEMDVSCLPFRKLPI
jgi:hypothetical protein